MSNQSEYELLMKHGDTGNDTPDNVSEIEEISYNGNGK